jgi:hypothetical protein
MLIQYTENDKLKYFNGLNVVAIEPTTGNGNNRTRIKMVDNTYIEVEPVPSEVASIIESSFDPSQGIQSL